MGEHYYEEHKVNSFKHELQHSSTRYMKNIATTSLNQMRQELKNSAKKGQWSAFCKLNVPMVYCYDKTEKQLRDFLDKLIENIEPSLQQWDIQYDIIKDISKNTCGLNIMFSWEEPYIQQIKTFIS